MRYDATGLDATDEFPLIPAGLFPFRITVAKEGKSSKGDPQVTVDCECIDPRYRGMNIRHWVTFLPKTNKGAGMPLHFLKCIGQPYEGVIDVNPFAWEGKKFMGKVCINEYLDENNNKKRNNKFEAISPMTENADKTVDESPFND